jgi:hypothetical protein
MSSNTVIINKAWIFPNGMYIFDTNGIQIDPNSQPGNDIRYLFWLQDYFRNENEKQKELVDRIRNASNSQEAIQILQELKQGNG